VGHRDIPQVIREFRIAVNTTVSTENSAEECRFLRCGPLPCDEISSRVSGFSRPLKLSPSMKAAKLAVACTNGSVYCCLSFDGARASPPVVSAKLDARDAVAPSKIVLAGRAKNVHA
jgi:hypothetical protein